MEIKTLSPNNQGYVFLIESFQLGLTELAMVVKCVNGGDHSWRSSGYDVAIWCKKLNECM